MSEQQPSPFSPGKLAVTLSELPGSIYDSDVQIAKLESQIAELKESLELTEINASLQAKDDGQNEAKRKLQRDQAVAQDPDVRTFRAKVRAAQEELEIAKAYNKQQSREFAAYCHIEELKAAQMILMSKGQGVTQP